MAAPQFFVDSLDEPVRLSERDSRHALRSLRLRPGDDVTLSDGRGGVATAHLEAEDGGRALVVVDSVRAVIRRPPLVSIALAPPKGDRLGWAVQKLTELGVDETVLIQTERSVRGWDPRREARAVDRLAAVVREAAMQSRQPFLMEVKAGFELDDVLSGRGVAAALLWEGQGGPLAAALPEDAGAVRLIIGPEGGFTDAEVERVKERGTDLASLGGSILRTETAAIAGAVLALSRYGRLG